MTSSTFFRLNDAIAILSLFGLAVTAGWLYARGNLNFTHAGSGRRAPTSNKELFFSAIDDFIDGDVERGEHNLFKQKLDAEYSRLANRRG